MTEADIVHFSGFSGDFNPLHTDAEYASKGMFGERIAHGMCVFQWPLAFSFASIFLKGQSLPFMESMMAFSCTGKDRGYDPFSG